MILTTIVVVQGVDESTALKTLVNICNVITLRRRISVLSNLKPYFN